MYIVIGSLNNQYVFLSNGDTKCIDNPKKKKIKHLDFCDDIDDEIKSAIINRDNDIDLKIKDIDVVEKEDYKKLADLIEKEKEFKFENYQ